MHAELRVKHLEADRHALADLLNKKFGPKEDAALDSSEEFRNMKWPHLLVYARRSPRCLMVVMAESNEELHVTLELDEAYTFGTCQSVWNNLAQALSSLKPAMAEMNLVAKRPFFRATTGMAAELKRRETIIPLCVGTFTLPYFVIGAFTFASDNPLKFGLGAMSGLVTAVLTLCLAVRESRRGTRRWIPYS